MSSKSLEQIEAYLRAGKAQEALQFSQKYCEDQGATKDQGIALARIAASVYRDFITPPVLEFSEEAPSALPPEVGLLVNKALGRLSKITEEWEGKLWEVHTERLARELRDWTRMKYLDGAASNISRLMALAPEGSRGRRASYIGNVLGTVINNQKEAQQVLTKVAKGTSDYQVSLEEVNTMNGARDKRYKQIANINFENLENEYSNTLTQTIVEIKGVLPDENKMGDPDENVLREVGDTFRSILRIPIWREEPDLLLDATYILTDYVPREQSATAKAARIEGRIYNSLGFQAKKAVQLVFMDIGKNRFFTSIYRSWAQEYVGTDALKSIIELMGAFRSQDFNDFFNQVKSDKRVSESVNKQIGSAFGSVAGSEAIDELLGSLKSLLGKRNISSSDLKEVEKVLSNLGQIIKSPRTEDKERNHIREYLINHLPEDLMHQSVHCALECFTARPNDMQPKHLQWAIRVLGRGLWMKDDTTQYHKGGGELGFREPLIEALKKLGKRDAHCFVRAVEPLSTRYGLGMVAAASVFEELNDKEGIPVLERMLNTALMHDDRSDNVYQQEFYWDTATEQRKPVTKDKIVGPVVYAVGKIGGSKARSVLKRYENQIATGKAPPPSGEVAAYLERFLTSDPAEDDQEEDGVDDSESQVSIPKTTDAKALIKQATGRYFFSGKSKRRRKKIEALTRLGQLTPIEAIDPLFKLLNDKDPMVVSAAIGCLTEFAEPEKPQAVRDMCVNTCLDTMESRDPAMRQSAIKLLKEIGPNRKDVRGKVAGFAKAAQTREVRDILERVLKTGKGAPDPQSQMAELDGKSEDSKAPGQENMNKLELKREYMEARRQWIQNGKKGDPPSKPPGID